MSPNSDNLMWWQTLQIRSSMKTETKLYSLVMSSHFVFFARGNVIDFLCWQQVYLNVHCGIKKEKSECSNVADDNEKKSTPQLAYKRLAERHLWRFSFKAPACLHSCIRGFLLLIEVNFLGYQFAGHVGKIDSPHASPECWDVEGGLERGERTEKWHCSFSIPEPFHFYHPQIKLQTSKANLGWRRFP